MRKVIFTAGGIVTGFILAVALQIGIGGSAGAGTADAQLATEAPAIPVSAVAPNAATADAPVAAAPAKVAEAPVNSTSRFAIDPTQSTAKILVAQTGLLGDSTLVGNGTNVSGDIFLTSDGHLGNSPSALALDMQTMHSSDSALNSFLKNNVEPSKYPTATFAIQSVDGIPATYVDGNEFNFTMTGPMTMHGQTRTATWTVKARQVGNFLTMAADTDFNMTDYGWTPPNYGVAKAKNAVHLQVVVVAGLVP